MGALTVEMSELQKQMTAKSFELSAFCAESDILADNLAQVKMQNGAGGTVSDKQHLAAINFEHPSKRAKAARP